MTLKISLALNGIGGFVAAIESEHDDVRLDTDHESTSPKDICEEAASILEAAAKKFRLLALEAKPTHEKTHNRINRS